MKPFPCKEAPYPPLWSTGHVGCNVTTCPSAACQGRGECQKAPSRVGKHFADYSQLSAAEIAAPDPELDALYANSTPVADSPPLVPDAWRDGTHYTPAEPTFCTPDGPEYCAVGQPCPSCPQSMHAVDDAPLVPSVYSEYLDGPPRTPEQRRLQHAPKMRPPLKTAPAASKGACYCDLSESDCIKAGHPVNVQGKARQRLIDTDSATRKTYPLFSGLLAYFPDALAEVARLSFLGNEKHNPDEPMHHARSKSTDHADCAARHLVNHGGFDGDTRESAALAWRGLALLQEELEREFNLPLPRGARA